MIKKVDNLSLILELNTVGIKLPFSQGALVAERLEELAEESKKENPIYSCILSSAKENLSGPTWQGIDRKGSQIIRGSSYRLSVNEDEGHLVKLRPWHSLAYAPVRPQFL